MKTKITNLIVHPLLFAIYPVLFLYSQNQDETFASSIIRSGVVSLMLGIIVYLLSTLIVKNKGRAALVASAFVILFFTYGHFYEYIRATFHQIYLFGKPILRHRYLAVVWVLILIGSIWLICKKLRDKKGTNQILNMISITLVLFVLIQVYVIKQKNTNIIPTEVRAEMANLGISTFTDKLHPPLLAKLPDIYYIILDSYTRADVVKDVYGYDNTPFLKSLKERGFYVVQCGRSNYSKTAFSLTSSMNLQYMMPLGEKTLESKVHWREFGPYFRHSGLRYTLEDLGYKSIAFETSHHWANMTDADIYFSLPNGGVTTSEIFQKSVNGFEQMLVKTTFLESISPIQKQVEGSSTENANHPDDETAMVVKEWTSNEERLYNMTKYSLDRLEEVPSLPGPKFVFAHMMPVHTPYVFREDGSFYYDNNPVSPSGYVRAMKYTNQRILEIIDKIKAQSNPEPIIIIQGDHAPNVGNTENWDKILNAYYLPNGGNDLLYPAITPVNTFRIVFDRYFGGKFGLLEDKSYMLDQVNEKYIFTPSEETNPSCINK